MSRAYRLLLRLLPRDRRDRYGAAMALVFSEQLRDTRARRGLAAAGALLMKETGGLARFAVRERWARVLGLMRRRRHGGSGGGRTSDELRWAWRGVRARGWRAGLVVLLIGAALAANTLVFAVSDALVFRPLPYRDPASLVEIQSRTAPNGRADSFLSAALLDEWRKQSDLFQAVHGYLTKTVFVLGDGMADLVQAADVTPGLIEMLGTKPAWGRSLTEADAREVDVLPVLLSEDLARQHFGDPAAAVGRRVETSAQTLLVVGVMRAEFRFPRDGIRIWRALDPRGPLARNFASVASLARLAPGIGPDISADTTGRRAQAIGQATGRPTYSATVTKFGRPARPDLFVVLLGAAWCLLLTACGNVAGLELTGATVRARTYAVQLALGASRSLLARVALWEGAWLLVGSLLVAGSLAWGGMAALDAYLPSRLTSATLNPIDLDARALVYMIAAATLAWLLAVLPVVFFASRPRLMEVLKIEGRSAATSRAGARLGRFLTVGEIAIGVLLLVGGALYARSYRAQLGITMGFDSTNVATLTLALPPQLMGQRPALVQGILDKVGAVTGVIAVTDEFAPPFFGTPWGDVKLEVDARAPLEAGVMLSVLEVQPAYFDVLGIPLVRGRHFGPDDPPTSAIVTEDFAARIWPGADAVGRRFRRQPTEPWYDVIGVTGHLRSESEGTARAGEAGMLLAFAPRRPPPPPRPMTPERIRTMATGGSYGIANFIVRLDTPGRAAAVLSAARAVDPRFRVTLSFIDDNYAETFGSTLVAAQVVGVFGVLAAVIAAVGVYGVMAFLVAGRRREIGIRMALGADRRAVTQLVLGSSMRLVMIGAVVGLAGAAVLSRYVQSQLFGVTATDPATYAAVALVVTTIAALATWQPARQAAAVDPAITLRAE